MTSDRTERIALIFDEAAELPAEQRRAFLDDSCGGDDALRREVETLLAADGDTDEFLESPPAESVAELLNEQAKADQRQMIGRTLGDFRITDVLGEGGMSDVYLAEQQHPQRTVALKVIKPGMATGSMLKRFEHESQILARLQHPGIAQVYESGTADTGFGPQPFFAMELVRGLPLDEFAASRNLTARQRLELMVEICDAVQHAHQKGVIHRDLKPANIMVDDSSGTTHPKVLDFGIARLRRDPGDRTAAVTQTGFGEMVGTLPYMSPEQVSGDPSAIDTRSDIYALGVVCYELLAERLPYDVRNQVVHEAARIIREVPPKSLGSINRAFRGDVETIINMALEKEPARRYQSAAAFGSDLQRYFNTEPIIARPISTIYQLRMFTRRNKALVGGAVATLLALVIGIVATTTLWMRAEDAEVEARNSERKAISAANEARHQRDLAENERRQHEQKAIEAEYALFLLSYSATDDRTIDTLRRLIEVYRRNGETEKAAEFDRMLDSFLRMKAMKERAEANTDG